MVKSCKLKTETFSFNLTTNKEKYMKIRYDENGKILAIGTEIDAPEIAEELLPADFMSTFGHGKYKVQDNGGSLEIVEVPGFVMPEKAEWTLEEVQNMSLEQLTELQVRLQTLIDSIN